MERKVIYYKDELNDEFSEAKIDYFSNIVKNF